MYFIIDHFPTDSPNFCMTEDGELVRFDTPQEARHSDVWKQCQNPKVFPCDRGHES